MKNYNFVEVLNKQVAKSLYPEYNGGDYILAETGVLHFSYTSRIVRNATAHRILQLELTSKARFMELSGTQVADFVSGRITVIGFAEKLNNFQNGKADKPSKMEDPAKQKSEQAKPTRNDEQK